MTVMMCVLGTMFFVTLWDDDYNEIDDFYI